MSVYLVLNGPHRGKRFPAIAGPVIRLPDYGDLWWEARIITYTLQTLAVEDGDTRKTHHFWLTEGTEGGAVTMVDLLIDLGGGEGE